MEWMKRNWQGVVLALLGLFVAWNFLSGRMNDGKVRKAEALAASLEATAKTLADIAKKEARDGQAARDEAEALRTDLDAANREKDRFASRVSTLEKQLHPAPNAPVGGGPVGDGERDDWRRAVESRDALIVALKDEQAQTDVVLKKTEALAASLTRACDGYKSAYEGMAKARDADAQANVQLRAALDAQKGLTRAAYWKGFLHGSMVGAAADRFVIPLFFKRF